MQFSECLLWDKSYFNEKDFKVVEPEPFNEEQTLEFFNKSFNNDAAKARKALKISNEFTFPGAKNNHLYHPYVLDIIRSIIDNEKQTLEIDLSEFSSHYLRNDLKNDYIIYRVCDREIKRVGQIEVDDQIKFFINFAVDLRGICSNDGFKNHIESVIGTHVDSVNVEAFKSHPFLKKDDQNFLFKYDFLGDIFRSIFMASIFDFSSEKSPINQSLLTLLKENCWFGSPLNQEIVHRVPHFDDDDILFISQIIEEIYDFPDVKEEKKRKAVANVFNLSLSIMHKLKENNIENNTQLLLQLFGKNLKTVNRVSIINIHSDQNIKFDFSNLEIHDSYFENYSSFWDCKFNGHTRFINTHLLSLRSKRNYSLSKNNFIDCTYDSEVESSISRIEETRHNRVGQMKLFVNQFFHMFLSNGRLGRQWEEKIILPRYSGINKVNIDYKKLMRVLKQNDYIEISQELNKNKLSIPDVYKEEVGKFIKDGTVSDKIGKIIKELSEIS